MRVSKSGFTIVELLIATVVIGILAAISIVAFNNVKVRALDASRTATLENIQKMIEMFYVENGAYPSPSELIGSAGATTLGVSIGDLSPPEGPDVGLRYGWSITVVEKPTAADYRFSYITHPNANGSGLSCPSTQRCQSYDLTYRMADGTPHRFTNPENPRGR